MGLGRLGGGGLAETSFGDIPGGVWACSRVSGRPTSCRDGHYLFTDYGTVVRDGADEIDRCQRHCCGRHLGFP